MSQRRRRSGQRAPRQSIYQNLINKASNEFGPDFNVNDLNQEFISNFINENYNGSFEFEEFKNLSNYIENADINDDSFYDNLERFKELENKEYNNILEIKRDENGNIDAEDFVEKVKNNSTKSVEIDGTDYSYKGEFNSSKEFNDFNKDVIDFKDSIDLLNSGESVEDVSEIINSMNDPQKHIENYLKENHADSFDLEEFGKNIEAINADDVDYDDIKDIVDDVTEKKQRTYKNVIEIKRDENGNIDVNDFLEKVKNNEAKDVDGGTYFNEQTDEIRARKEKEKKEREAAERARQEEKEAAERARKEELERKEIERKKKKAKDLKDLEEGKYNTKLDHIDSKIEKYKKDLESPKNQSPKKQERIKRKIRSAEQRRNELLEKVKDLDKEAVSSYLDNQAKVHNAEYDSLAKDIDTVGEDFLDAYGNKANKLEYKARTTVKKAGKKIKGILRGDMSDYDEYVSALKNLESLDPEDVFARMNTSNLFDVDENGRFNNPEKILRPEKEEETAEEIFRKVINNRNIENATEEVADDASKFGAKVFKENLEKSHPRAKKLLTTSGLAFTGLNLFYAYNTYDEERKNGRTVFGSAIRASADFALGEVLGMKYMALQAAEAAPKMVVKGFEGVNKLTREKNNMARHEAFGYASFQDTQQLATMRQSGMEMAKMANYNLQQTLMGNEAKYLHR